MGVVEGSSVMGISEAEMKALSEAEYRNLYEKTEQVYREAGADYVIAHLGQLLEILEL